jgi:hypothetical protein
MNCSLQKRLDGIAMIQEIIEERRLDWLGNVTKTTQLKSPKETLDCLDIQTKNQLWPETHFEGFKHPINQPDTGV